VEERRLREAFDLRESTDVNAVTIPAIPHPHVRQVREEGTSQSVDDKNDREIDKDLETQTQNGPQMKELSKRMDDLADLVADAVIRLEERQRRIEDQNRKMLAQNMIMESEKNAAELRRIFGIDRTERVEPSEIEGILADYSDSQSSVEWVRSVRDGH